MGRQYEWSHKSEEAQNDLWKKSLHVVVPLDPAKGVLYTEPIHDDDSDDDLDCIYKIKIWEEDRVNPSVDGRISWQRKSTCTSDSDK